MRRLGPQDPLSWVRDTREKSPPPRERGPVQQGINRALPAERRTFKIQSEGENPIEVTVVVKGEKEDRIICVKVAEEGRKATKIEVRNSDPQKESPNQEAAAS